MDDSGKVPSHRPQQSDEGYARGWSRISGCCFLVLLLTLLLLLATLAAVSIDARTLLTPWAIGAALAAIGLFVARPLRVVLAMGILFGLASAAYWAQGYVNGTDDMLSVSLLVGLSLAGALGALRGALRLRSR